MESNLYGNVPALLKEIINRRASQKGKLRWSLEKKLDESPTSRILLIQLVLRELENCFVTQQISAEGNTSRVFKTESLMDVVPLLHTLYYTVIQSSAGIPAELYQNLHECLMKLMILPPPFSSVASATLRSIKTERTTPGCLYHSRVVLEQNLKTEQEKVFVLADPAVCSELLQEAIQEHLEEPHVLRDKTAMQVKVILHVLHAGLGTQCHSSRVAQALQILGDQWTETYFQRVSAVIEDSVKQGADGHVHYLLQLKDIHSDIVSASTEEATLEDQDPGSASPLPSPHVQFIMWHNDDDLWELLLNFSLHCEPNSCSRDRDGLEPEEGEEWPGRKPSSAFSRRKAFKNLKSADKVALLREQMEAFNGGCTLLKSSGGRHTARVVVMGDDRVLGRLAKSYRAIRERESKRLILTKRLKLRFYYIPLAPVETPPETPGQPHLDAGVSSVSSFLGRVDPWYHSNINGLQTSIAKLYEMHCKKIKPSKHNLFLLDTLCYYLRCGSHHVKLPLYSVQMTRSTPEGNSVVEEMFLSRLDADIPEFKHLKEKSPEMQFAVRGKKLSGYGASLSISYARVRPWSLSSPQQRGFCFSLLCIYCGSLQTSLSKRKDVKGEASMAYGVVITSEPSAVSSGENYLRVKFDYMNPECNTEIRTKSLIIKTVASRTLSVRLDQDPRRTYSDVQRLEVSLCVDPGNKIRSSFGGSIQSEPALSQCLDKVLLLPINTFSSLAP